MIHRVGIPGLSCVLYTVLVIEIDWLVEVPVKYAEIDSQFCCI